MMYGITIGPNAVHDHEIPVTILRFSLKYVFNAREFALVHRPTPAPKRLKIVRNLSTYKIAHHIKLKKSLKK